MGYAPFYGVWSATTNAMPTEIKNNDLQKTGAGANFLPHVVIVGTSVLSQF